MQHTRLEVSFPTSFTASETAIAFPFSDPLALRGAGSPHFQAALTVLGVFFSQSVRIRRVYLFLLNYHL